MNKALIIGTCVAVLPLGALAMSWPRPIATASEATGDTSIDLSSLTEHGKVTSFVLTPQGTHFLLQRQPR